MREKIEFDNNFQAFFLAFDKKSGLTVGQWTVVDKFFCFNQDFLRTFNTGTEQLSPG